MEDNNIQMQFGEEPINSSANPKSKLDVITTDEYKQ